MQMPEPRRYQTEWERLRLVVEARPIDTAVPEHWQLFVYDVENCEVLHTAKRLTLDIAKIGAVEYAIGYRFGRRSDLEPGIISGMLEWKAVATHR